MSDIPEPSDGQLYMGNTHPWDEDEEDENVRRCSACLFNGAADGDIYCAACRSGIDRNPDLVRELPF